MKLPRQLSLGKAHLIEEKVRAKLKKNLLIQIFSFTLIQIVKKMMKSLIVLTNKREGKPSRLEII